MTAPAPKNRGCAHGAVAQLGERCNRTAEVRGSTPLGSTTSLPLCANSLAQLGYASENSLRSGWHTLVTVQGVFTMANLRNRNGTDMRQEHDRSYRRWMRKSGRGACAIISHGCSLMACIGANTVSGKWITSSRCRSAARSGSLSGCAGARIGRLCGPRGLPPALRLQIICRQTAAARFPIHWERALHRAIATAR